MYYPDEAKFSNGIVIADAREGGEEQVQAAPYGCGGLWERFTVTWDSTVRLRHSSLHSTLSNRKQTLSCELVLRTVLQETVKGFSGYEILDKTFTVTWESTVRFCRHMFSAKIPESQAS